MQKIYEAGGAQRNIKKLFAYGTLHGGIHFDIAGGQLVENLGDMVGYHIYRSKTKSPNSDGIAAIVQQKKGSGSTYSRIPSFTLSRFASRTEKPLCIP